VTVVPLADVRPEEIYAVEVDALRDEPSDMTFDSIPFEDWRRLSWDDSDLDLGVSVAARVDGRITAFTRLTVLGERAWSDLTAVSRSHRGRGLAKLLKAVALSRAAERGVELATTANDAANGPMLAVNAWLGYRPVAVHWSCLSHRGK
jgi:GNAT superfamily N-acetyltransferase